MRAIHIIFLGIFTPSLLLAQHECRSNNAFVQACKIPLTGLTATIDGSIDPGNDVDFFWFEIPCSGVITYTVMNVPGNLAMSASLFHESDQRRRVDGEAAGNGVQVKGIKKVCPAGKYYIKLNGFGSQHSPDSYTLQVSLDTTDVHECNDAFVDCTPIEPNQDVQGTIQSGLDHDFYCFELSAPGDISFTVMNVPGTLAMTASLFHESDQVRAVTRAGAKNGVQVKGGKTACPTGKYYLKLNAFGSQQSPDPYTLKVVVSRN